MTRTSRTLPSAIVERSGCHANASLGYATGMAKQVKEIRAEMRKTKPAISAN